MKKQKKFLVSIIVFFTILLSCCQVFATELLNYSGEMEFSEEFKEYMELSEEEKQNVIMPRAFEIFPTQTKVTNPFKLAKIVKSSLSTNYSLRDIIPENMVIKNQSPTNSCWTFSSLATLESTLALNNYKNKVEPKVYDFSERHMEYATSKTFLDGINKNGFNREIDSGGNFYFTIPYFTNGTGAILEESMKFKSEPPQKILLSELNNKTVVTEVDDITLFSSYSTTEELKQLQTKMKEHIMNYGAIDACIHGASINLNSKVYNNSTGALYCNSASLYPIDHAVAIIGWDDNYGVENFLEGNRPQNKGAWIIKNSWGTDFIKFTLLQVKEAMIANFPEECKAAGWTEANQIPDEYAKQFAIKNGYTINENNEAVIKVGDDGFMYVSYEDANIHRQLTGIQKAQDEISYENIYQYDRFAGATPYKLKIPKIYLGTIFDRQTSGAEYLTQVSIYATEKYTCKVFVNVAGASMAKNDLKQVELKNGSTETFEAGYHTIEFAKPIKIEGGKFAVVLEIQGSEPNKMSIMMEFNPADYASVVPGASNLAKNLAIYNNVTVESGKCFASTENEFNNNIWTDTSKILSLTNGNWPNFDTTIKAFTTSKVLEKIEVTNPPIKTKYVEGQDFDKTGMVVKGIYANGTSKEITDYEIANATNLKVGQTNVEILYKDFKTTQNITVVKNVVEKIEITTPPTKKDYIAGEAFEADGMVVKAIYTDGTQKTITNYTIEDGKELKNGQTSVTISYEGKNIKQNITVKPNAVVRLEITNNAKKLKYVEGQNFNPEGLKIKAIYESGMEKEVSGYTIKDGKNLKQNQTTVTIEFEGKTVTQSITVEVKAIINMSIKTMPTKTEYIQNKENLDLSGGIIEISYNDGAKEELKMTSEEIIVSGFDNKTVGKQKIMLTYESKSVEFEIEIKEEEKPENSKFNNMQGNVTKVRIHQFTDTNKDEYTILNVEVSGITKSTVNESMEYYYYISGQKEEQDITKWVKINQLQEAENSISFEINTLDVSNYEDIIEAETLYLYIKEVATRNNMKAEKITQAMELEIGNMNIEEYLDGEKKTEVNPGDIPGATPGEGPDNTLVSGEIPKAGKSMLIIALIVIIFIVGRFSYLRYKDIKIK